MGLELENSVKQEEKPKIISPIGSGSKYRKPAQEKPKVDDFPFKESDPLSSEFEHQSDSHTINERQPTEEISNSSDEVNQ